MFDALSKDVPEVPGGVRDASMGFHVVTPAMWNPEHVESPWYLNKKTFKIAVSSKIIHLVLEVPDILDGVRNDSSWGSWCSWWGQQCLQVVWFCSPGYVESKTVWISMIQCQKPCQDVKMSRWSWWTFRASNAEPTSRPFQRCIKHWFKSLKKRTDSFS